MPGLTKKLIQKLITRFFASFKHELEFFKKPKFLALLLGVTSLTLLSKFSDKFKNLLKSLGFPLINGINEKKQIEDYIKNNSTTKAILKYSNNNLDEDILSSLLLECETGESVFDTSIFNSIGENLNGEDYLAMVTEASDIDEKSKLISGFEDLLSDLSGFLDKALPFLFLILYIIELTKELLTQSDFPSKYRMKYIQKLIRTVYGLIKSIYNELKPEGKKIFGEILDTLRGIDGIIVAAGMATSMYLHNLKLLQDKSLEFLGENYSTVSCGNELEKSSNPETITSPLKDSINLSEINCEIPFDEVIVPSKPFEIKLEEISCEISEEQEQVLTTPKEKIDLVTKASIQFKKSETDDNIQLENLQPIGRRIIYKKDSEKFFEDNNEIFTPLKDITVGSVVNTQTPIISFNNKIFYSPVEGTIFNIEKNRIDIKDISNIGEDFLSKSIEDLNKKYTELANVSNFLKNWNMISLFPIMVRESFPIKKPELYDGVRQQYDIFLSNYDKKIDSYNKNIKIVAGKDNVKKNAENETLNKIKEDVDNENKLLYDYIKLNYKKSITTAKITYANSNDYVAVDYYEELVKNLENIDNPSDIEEAYTTKILEFLIRRMAIDGYEKTKIEEKINSLSKDLFGIDELENLLTIDPSINIITKRVNDEIINIGEKENITPPSTISKKGIHIIPKFVNYFKTIKYKYDSSKDISKVESYLKKIASLNTKLSTIKKEKIIEKILFLFNYWLEYDSIAEKYKNKEIIILNPKLSVTDPKSIPKILFDDEGYWIQKFIDNIWIKYYNLPREINEILESLDKFSSFNSYVIKEIKGEEYKVFYISNDTFKCDLPDDKDSYLNPRTKEGYGSMKYWLKYCAYATLASVLKFPNGWATGLILPVGKIPFPIVYIPIKAFSTGYGFIVIGITLCGIFPWPWVLFSNLSSNYNLPIADPFMILRNEISNLKTEISNSLLQLKKNVLKKYLDKTKKDIDSLNIEINNLNNQIKIHNENRPPKILKNISKYGEWKERKLIFKEQSITLKTEKFKLATKYRLIYEAYSIGKPIGENNDSTDIILSSIEQQEKIINNQLDNLIVLTDNLDKVLAPFPFTLQPETTNFGPSLKKPTPINKIDTNLDDNINYGILNPIYNSFQLKNDDLMSSNYNNKLDNSILNFDKYKNSLSGSMNTIIQKDPFPKYEMLTPLNFFFPSSPWGNFLRKKWAVTGGNIYGFPI